MPLLNVGERSYWSPEKKICRNYEHLRVQCSLYRMILIAKLFFYAIMLFYSFHSVNNAKIPKLYIYWGHCPVLQWRICRTYLLCIVLSWQLLSVSITIQFTQTSACKKIFARSSSFISLPLSCSPQIETMGDCHSRTAQNERSRFWQHMFAR